MDIDPEVLRSELAGAFTPPETSAPAPAAEPTVADDFAAGLQREAVSLGRSADTKTATADPKAERADPITLQPGATASRPQPSAFPSVGGLLGRKESVRFAPPAEERSTVNDETAAEAFGARPRTPSTQVTPFATRDAASDSTDDYRRESFGDAVPAATPSNGVLVANQAPAITSDIRGPQQITIGREATYEVRLRNTGASTASEVVATVRIPSWAEVVSTTSTQGVVRQVDGGEPSGTIQWQIPRLESQGEETLRVELIPRASRPLELGITWTHAPVDARTVVEVQEPKLQMQVSGPDDVLYGKSHVYRLTLTNPGTGTAENVRIDLMPPGGGEESVSTHTIGNLPPGANKAVEVELTAREAGKLNVKAVARAEGGLVSEATKELFCRKPELQVDWRGPEMQYAGTAATYFFRVRNPGTAAADDVAVRVTLPGGAEFVSASEGYSHDADAGEVVWRVGSLGPGDDCYMELRCVVNTPGDNQLRVAAATAAGDLTDNKLATTKVVALADLTLDVSDPTGPVPVDDAAVYEIRVTNRGASAAEDVNVVGLFSAGLEPETIEGTPYTTADGRVSFRPIRKLPAGQHVVLSIRARATQPGTHVFRAEVLCRDLEIKLAAEETTRFYESQITHEPTGSEPTMIGAGAAEIRR
jgi:uncharacterized repeat protein (TIGR01451 family)